MTRRSPAEVTAIDLALAAETTEILRARGDYDAAGFADYLADATLCIALPGEITAKWIRWLSGNVADDFTRWMAGGRR
jgi:hypothetical protein